MTELNEPPIIADAVRAFFPPHKSAVLAFLARSRDAEGTLRVDIIEGTGFKPARLAVALTQLEEVGVITCDIPPGERHGKRVRYSLNCTRVAQLADALSDFVLGADNPDLARA